VKVETGADLREALGERIGSGKPSLVEVGVAPGMWLA
jgi:thiamine pyrophosphate-dependent acetolactate synthase large subunit-like protein